MFEFFFIVIFDSANVVIFSRDALALKKAHFVAFAYFGSPQQDRQNIYASKNAQSILC